MPLTGPADFERLVLPHLNAAHNLARWLVSDPTMAEDVTQDAMLRALDYAASFRGGDPRAWLLRIVRNTAYDALAARRRSPSISLDIAHNELEPLPPQLIDPADTPESALQRRQSTGRLAELIAALPIELRECLILRDVEELSYKEIALIIGIPIGTVMSRLWRARRAVLSGQIEGRSP